MKIVNDFPPNYQEICRFIPAVAKSVRVVFTYGDTLYSPYGKGDTIVPELMAHEETHSNRQLKMGVDKWWHEYLTDPQFRFMEELIAYQIQWSIASRYPKKRRRLILNAISKNLSSPMYGNIVSTRKQASELIRQGARP